MLSRLAAYARLWVSPARRSLVWITAGVIVSTAASFLVAILTARGMSPSDRGAFLQIQAMLAIAALLSQGGMGLPIISLANGSVTVSDALVRRTRGLVWTVTAIASLACSYWSVQQLPGTTASTAALGLVVLATTPLMVLGNRMLIRTRVQEDYPVLGIASALPTGIPAVINSVLYATGDLTPLTALAAFLIGVLAIVALVWSRERFHPPCTADTATRGEEAHLSDRQEVLRLGLLDLLAFGPSSVTGRLEIIVIGATLSAAAASEFAVAASLSSPMGLLSTTLYSYFGSRYASAARAQRPRLLRMGLQYTLIAATGISVVAIAAAIPLVPILYGEQYASAVAPGAVLAMAGIASTVGLVASLALRLERRYTVVLVTSYLPLVAVLTVGWVAAKQYGLMGFALVLGGISVLEAAAAVVIAIRESRKPKADSDASSAPPGIAEMAKDDSGAGSD